MTFTDSETAQYDVIVIGSGPGGASVAKELALKGVKVMMLEWGDNVPLAGTVMQMAKIAVIPGKGLFVERDGSLILRGITTGGSTPINYATAMPPPPEMFKVHGIDLTAEIEAVRNEIHIAPLPDQLMGPMATLIMASAQALGLNWRKLDKMIDPGKCRPDCWRCTYGCPFGAKWNARMLLDEAIAHGAGLITHARVSKILTRHKRAIGVEYTRHGRTQQVYANTIVLAAGGIGTPQILHASGIKNAGQDFFVDPVVAVMGSIKGLKGGREVPMAAGMHLKDEGIMLADMTLPKPLFMAFAAQTGRFDRLFSHASTLTLMVKIKDQLGGRIGRFGPNKMLSTADKNKLHHGTTLAKDILSNAGANSIFKSWHFAAHPGGSAKIGEVVDNNLQTEIQGLHVCDASVIPAEWGLPPTFTLLCLGKRLAKALA